MSEIAEPQLQLRTQRSKAPYVMRRVAGMSLEGLREMRAQETIRILQEIAELKRWLVRHTPSLVERLEQEVPNLQSDALRNQLIRYKRDMYNGRVPKQTADAFQAELPTELLDRMRHWESTYAAIAEQEGNARLVYAEELHHSRQTMHQLANNLNFRNGVLLTSLDLHAKVLKYIQTPLDQQNARLRKIEYTISTILSRTVMKTSPFSTFTPVGMAGWAQEEQAIYMPETPQHIPSVRINHTHVLRVLRALTQHPEVKPHLRYRLHPSFVINKGKLMLMRRLDDPKLKPRVFLTTESHVSVDYSPPMQKVVESVRAKPAGTCSYDELLGSLAGLAPRPQIEGFLNQLLQLTILQPAVDVPDQTEDILAEVIPWIEQWPGEVAAQTAQVLQTLADRVRAYPNSSLEARAAFLRESRERMEELYDLLGLAEAKGTLSLLFYEDASLPQVKPLSEQQYAGVLEDLYLYQELAPLFDVKYRLQSAIAHTFVQHYGEDGICTNTSSFIQRLIPINQWFLKAMMYGELHADLEVANDIEPIRKLNELKIEFADLLCERLQSGEDVVFTRDDLVDLIARIPDCYKRRPTSHGVFGQWVERGEDSLWVMNQGYPGVLTFFSRFLAAHEQEGVREEMRAYLNSLFEGTGAMAELAGVYGFNANVHDPLSELELFFADLPLTRQEGEEEVQRIEWEEVAFVYDKQTERVMLHHPSVGKFQGVFFGTLIPLMIPTLVRMMINLFSNSLLPNNLYMFEEHRLTPDERSQRIRVYPRIQFGRVVVSRKKWMVPRSELPLRGIKEEDFEWFARVQEWRERIGLPQRVFVKLSAMGEQEDPYGVEEAQVGEQREADVDFTQFKPQYIDFANPMLVRLFAKLILDSHQGLKIDELLPDLEEVEPLGYEHPYVSETTIELSQRVREEA